MILAEIYDTVSETFLKLLVAIAILLIGIVFARFFGNVTKKLLNQLDLNNILQKQTKIKIPLEEFLSALVKYITYLIVIIIALNQLGLTTTVLYIILIVILALIIAFIVLALKDFIPNLVAGLFIYQKLGIKIGDKIKVKNVDGKIIDINLIEVKVKTKSGDIIHIPNSLLTKNIVVKKK